MLLRVSAVLLAAGMLTLSGCGPAKLDVSKTYNLDGDPKIVLLDPQPKPQKVTVEFESTGDEVIVLLIKADDVPKDEDGFVPVAKAIASKKDKSGSFSGDVPEKTETKVIVRGGGMKGELKLRVHNR